MIRKLFVLSSLIPLCLSAFEDQKYADASKSLATRYTKFFMDIDNGLKPRDIEYPKQITLHGICLDNVLFTKERLKKQATKIQACINDLNCKKKNKVAGAIAGKALFDYRIEICAMDAKNFVLNEYTKTKMDTPCLFYGDIVGIIAEVFNNRRHADDVWREFKSNINCAIAKYENKSNKNAPKEDNKEKSVDSGDACLEDIFN